MVLVWLCALLVVEGVHSHFEAPQDLVVNTSCGPVQGAWDGQVVAYKGIPYAAPPVGRRRWQPPTSIVDGFCWSGVLPAAEFGAPCVQYGGPQPNTGQEDCLSLNIWTPHSGDLLPVHVFFYGGDLTQGKTSWYNMSEFAHAGPAIAVSVNYRLNVFGFLALSELSAVDSRGNVSGNYGFLDQQEALRWIQENIHHFGGDRRRVQIFGQSSGGTSVLALLASPASSGLFSSAISLSGSANMTMTLPVAQHNNRPLVHALGCDAGSEQTRLNCLLSANVSTLLTAAAVHGVGPYRNHSGLFDEDGIMSLPDCKDHCFGPGLGLAGLPGLPVVDGVTITRPLTHGLVIDVPVLFQTQAQEPDLGPAEDDRGMSAKEMRRRLTRAFARFPNVSIAALEHLYQHEMNTGGPQMMYETIVADIRVVCGNRQLARAADTFGTAPSYFSIVTSRPSHPVYIFSEWPISFAAHLLDLFSLLGIVDGEQAARDGACCTGPWATCTPLPRCNRQDGNATFAETAVDKANTRAQRAIAYTLATSGRLEFPTARNGGIVVDGRGNKAVPDLAAERCAFWEQNKFGPEFWWAD